MNGMYLIKCVDFVEDALWHQRKCVVVRTNDVYDENDGYYIEAEMLVNFMRHNGYRGGVVIEDNRDTFIVVDVDQKQMVPLSREWLSTFVDDYKLDMLSFEQFVRLHEQKYGYFRNKIIMSDKNGNTVRVITLDI